MPFYYCLCGPDLNYVGHRRAAGRPGRRMEAGAAMAVEVTFWGTRGSFPCATPRHMVYGGNTSCVSVQIDDTWVILDVGTGARELGKKLLGTGVRQATLLMSHSHTDHICGFPFFAPAWVPNFDLTIMAGHLIGRGGVREVFEIAMRDPVFPVPLAAMGGHTQFVDFRAGDTLAIAPGITARTTPLNHPNGATAYRIEAGGKSLCYVTDTEHTPGAPDRGILSLIKGCDLFIYDSTYTDEEYPTHVGWGHSTWQEGIRLAKKAGVGRLAIFHHDPDHTDDAMAEIERQAQATWSRSFVARDSLTLTL